MCVVDTQSEIQLKGEVEVRNQLLHAMAEQQNLMDALTAVSLCIYNTHTHTHTHTQGKDIHNTQRKRLTQCTRGTTVKTQTYTQYTLAHTTILNTIQTHPHTHTRTHTHTPRTQYTLGHMHTHPE